MESMTQLLHSHHISELLFSPRGAFDLKCICKDRTKLLINIPSLVSKGL